ncbi:hypothetical protein JOF28_001004 [Leucobacter exalbidus]|uniref:Uncharacterized protein n=1 Tax=Leucobacter exalbidus TaxID=662960 RepID=A0A940T347_9MICO|nr:hypothetical protein [Leucobacter exalbidus]
MNTVGNNDQPAFTHQLSILEILAGLPCGFLSAELLGSD